jgi:signal transduction histidine kinase
MRTSWRQYAEDHPRVVDAAMIVLLLCAAAGPAILNSGLPHTENLGWWSALPLAAAPALALLWRRGWPGAVVVFTALCVSAACLVGYLITPVLLAPVMVALYELAVRGSGPTTRGYWLAVTVLVVASGLLGNRYGYPWVLVVLSPVLFLLLPVAMGAAVKARAEYAERNREQEARHRVAEERLRIARDLHDVVAHHLALANAQAGTAAYLSRTRPDQVDRILADLTATTSSALRELKATVGVLRHPDDSGSPLEPAPGLRQLPELTAAFASAGLDVEVTVDGRQEPLSPDVDLTAFRIVQEALTNVTKHATTNTAHVRLSYGDHRLTVTVTNPPGFGLVGMRERAHAAGGHFHAGPDPAGAFTVTTELPILASTADS